MGTIRRSSTLCESTREENEACFCSGHRMKVCRALEREEKSACLFSPDLSHDAGGSWKQKRRF